MTMTVLKPVRITVQTTINGYQTRLPGGRRLIGILCQSDVDYNDAAEAIGRCRLLAMPKDLFDDPKFQEAMEGLPFGSMLVVEDRELWWSDGDQWAEGTPSYPRLLFGIEKESGVFAGLRQKTNLATA